MSKPLYIFKIKNPVWMESGNIDPLKELKTKQEKKNSKK